MTHEYYLTDGTTTIDLLADNHLVLNWTPNNTVFNSAPLATEDQGNRENVTENLSIRVHDAADGPAIQARIQAITSMIAAAEHRYVHGNGPKVYLQFKASGESLLWQSEVLGGALQLDGMTLREWASDGADSVLELYRRFFWEPTTDQALTLTSSAGSGTTVTITNNHDANWIRIADDQIEGDIATPIKIQLENNGSSMLGSHRIYISNNVFNDPTGFDGYLTDADLDVGTASESWGIVDHDLVSPVWAWDLPTTLLADCAGGWFRILAGFSSISDGTYIKPVVYSRVSGTNSVIWEGKEFLTGDSALTKVALLDLESIPLPPGGLDSASGVRLGLSIRDTTGGSGTIDFVEIVPTTSYTVLEKPSHDWGAGALITDNGIEGQVYGGTDSAREPTIIRRGPHIYAWPNKENRINLSYLFGTTFPTTNTVDVKVWCRPRRSTL